MNRRKLTAAIALIMGVAVVGFVAVSRYSGYAHEIGRTDPKRAANDRLPWFNFDESYMDGEVLGVKVGSSREAAIGAIERAGFVVDPAGWDDSRAGGASLYDKDELRSIMRQRPYLVFNDPTDLRRGTILYFRDDRVVSIRVWYVNTESL